MSSVYGPSKSKAKTEPETEAEAEAESVKIILRPTEKGVAAIDVDDADDYVNSDYAAVPSALVIAVRI